MKCGRKVACVLAGIILMASFVSGNDPFKMSSEVEAPKIVKRVVLTHEQQAKLQRYRQLPTDTLIFYVMKYEKDVAIWKGLVKRFPGRGNDEWLRQDEEMLLLFKIAVEERK
jgi:hypothetical protein